MKKSLYCQPIRVDRIEKIPAKIAKEADIVEIWLDHLKNLDFEKLLRIKTNKPFLYVLKSKREKGRFVGTEKERVELLIKSLDYGADYVDIDIKTAKSLLKKLINVAKSKKVKTIISYHNFEKTPKNLKAIYKKISSFNPEIIKFSTKINRVHDIADLFSLLKNADRKIITLGMGDKGEITRILAPKLGNYLYYAPLRKEEKTADGQLTYEELNKYWQ